MGMKEQRDKTIKMCPKKKKRKKMCPRRKLVGWGVNVLDQTPRLGMKSQ